MPPNRDTQQQKQPAHRLEWQSIVNRDKKSDGKFFYGVKTTGVYCRPSCGARLPKPENVAFFATRELALQAGFRPCKRCRPDSATLKSEKETLVESICKYIENCTHTPSLDELSGEFGKSTYHLQRTFKTVVGISPREYAETLRVTRLKKELRNTKTITAAIYDAGFESPSSVYERTRTDLGMTPSAYKAGGQALAIDYVVLQCHLGWLVVAATSKGVCLVAIADSREEARTIVGAEYPNATARNESKVLKTAVEHILAYLCAADKMLHQLPLDVRATAFQKKVWDLLKTIPTGETRTYSEIAEMMGQPQAVRAVARACATNPVALVVPCHRVIRTDGNLAGYRWGVKRKQQLLQLEQARAANAKGKRR